MRWFLAILIVFASTLPSVAEYPTVNPPYSLRQWNYSGGSCSYASVITLLKWQGKYSLARTLRRYCHGGTNPEVLAAAIDRHGVRFAETVGRRDVAFLRWACQTRRGAAIAIYGEGGNPYTARHMICLVHLDSKWAGLLDNNDPRKVTWMPANQFIRHWIASGSWAVVPVYSPDPPLPKRS